MRSDSLAGQVIDQAERSFDVASGKIGFVFDDFATSLEKSEPGLRNIIYRHFEDWAERGTLLDEEIDVRAAKADHVRLLAGDLEAEGLDVERRGLFRFRRLNQNICAEAVCHRDSLTNEF